MASSLPLNPLLSLRVPGWRQHTWTTAAVAFCYRPNHHRSPYNFLFFFSPPSSSSFSYSSGLILNAASRSITFRLWHLLTLLWWIHKITTMIAHCECFMETHYRVSISACLSVRLPFYLFVCPSLFLRHTHTRCLSSDWTQKQQRLHTDVKSLALSSLWSVLIRLSTLGWLIHLVRLQSFSSEILFFFFFQIAQTVFLPH